MTIAMSPRSDSKIHKDVVNASKAMQYEQSASWLYPTRTDVRDQSDQLPFDNQ